MDGICRCCVGKNCHFQTEIWTLKENTSAKNPVSFVPLQNHIVRSASDSLKYRSFLYSFVLGLAVLFAQRGGMLFHDDYI